VTAPDVLERVVSVVAECTRRDRMGMEPATLDELARDHGTSVAQIAADLRTITDLADDPQAEWLLSLRVWMEGNQVHLSSGGPFRRPLRFTPEEALAVTAGLATQESPPRDLMFALITSERLPEVAMALDAPDKLDLFLDAVRRRRMMEILYAGLESPAGEPRIIEPHQVVSAEGRWYVIAWCWSKEAWRRFRLDRVMDAVTADATFETRDDFAAVTDPGYVFVQPAEGVDLVRVRFAPAIARWIRERYPECEIESGGAAVVTFRVASVEWLVRHVLQYGDEAEVLEPAAYREAMRRAVQ
jgi:proteasome accessory factor C